MPCSKMLAVELWAAPVPVVGQFADHHWFVVSRLESADRWEVWQKADVGGDSWGHLHRNLMAPTAGVGSGEGRMLMRWYGTRAVTLANRIEASPRYYPWCTIYRFWPGPNSNTFVQWVLRNDHRLGWRAIGAAYWRRDDSMASAT